VGVNESNDRPTLMGSTGHYIGIIAILLALLGAHSIALILGVVAIVLGAAGGLRSGVIMGVLTVGWVALVFLAYTY
jgi:hypothetical protein